MFLSDQLYLKALEADNTNFDSIKKVIIEMINICFESMRSNLGTGGNEALIANFKRVNNTWKSVAIRLENENKGLIKPEGFEILVKSKQEFKAIHHIF